MEPKLISNQVYEAIQVPTLEEDMPSKSTILYANRYAGVQEVEMTDPELVDLINSSIGMAGSNVLVQLKQKMEKFRNGPWYIDSRDGVVYIHNRKLNQESVTNYIYQQENGELLSASFNMIEVFKPFAGIKSMFDAVSKTVHAISCQIADVQIGQQRAFQDLETWKRKQEFYRKYPDQPASLVEALWDQQERLAASVREYKAEMDRKTDIGASERQKYDAKSPEQRKADSRARANKSLARSDKRGLATEALRDNPNYNVWLLMCKQHGSGSKQASDAWKEVVEYAKGQYVDTKSPNDGVWDYYTTSIAIGVTVSSSTKPTSATWDQNAKGTNAINSWKVSHPGFQVTQVMGIVWKKGKRDTTADYFDPGFMGPPTRYFWHAYVNFKYFGLGTKRAVVRADKLLGDVFPRYSTPNLGATLQNAAGNVGRGKKEKRLQAELRVVGNPTLESMQQIGVYNVGKKYSGPWYIKSVDHSFEFGQGYICEIQLSKQVPKPGAGGSKSSVDTTGFQDNSEGPSVRKSTITSTSGKKGGKTSTGSQRSVSNRGGVTTKKSDGSIVTGSWNAATMELVSEEMSRASTTTEAERILEKHARAIVANDKRNKAQGTNTPYAKFGRTNSKGSVSITRVEPTKDTELDPTPISISGDTYNDIWVLTNQKREKKKKKK